jgi:peptide/nickel transport system permease protein
VIAESVPVPPVAAEEFSERRHLVWRRFRRHRIALVGAVVLTLLVLSAVFGHVIYPVDPTAIDNVNWQGNPLAPGIAGHPLGTDENGRDLLARLISGAQVSLTVAVFAVLM